MLTDLTASCEEIPVSTAHKDLFGHKGIVNTAIYMFKKLADGKLLERAYAMCNKDYQLVLAGHSLGGGVGAVLGMMLRPKHPSLHCYCFSPPGGLLTKSAVDYSKSFITSLVVGKDVVIRSGLPQLETLRADILRVLNKSQDHKWRIIGRSLSCCRFPLCRKNEELCESVGSSPVDDKALSELVNFSNAETNPISGLESKDQQPPHSSQADQVPLASAFPMFPPGQIIHVVRKWTKLSKQKRAEPGWTALWADNEDFDEVKISPVMIHDHMPDGVFNGLDSLLNTKGRKLRRPSAFVVPSRKNKNNRFVVRLNPAPLASAEHSDIPQHTASLLSVGHAKLDATDHSVATLTSFDNLSRPSLDLLADDADDSNSRSCTPFRPEMNSELAIHPMLTPDDMESSPFMVRSCPTIVAIQPGSINSGCRATPDFRSWGDTSGETESMGSTSNSSSNITSGSYYVDWSKPALRLSDEYMLSRTISTIHEVSETTDGRKTAEANADLESNQDSSSLL